MKYTGIYDDPLRPCLQHITELCRKCNSEWSDSNLSLLRGAINMSHTFGLDVTVYNYPEMPLLLYADVYDTETEELLRIAVFPDVPIECGECHVYAGRLFNTTFNENSRL